MSSLSGWATPWILARCPEPDRPVDCVRFLSDFAIEAGHIARSHVL